MLCIEEAGDTAKVAKAKKKTNNRTHDTDRAKERDGKSEEGKEDREIVKDQRNEGVTRRDARQLTGQKYQATKKETRKTKKSKRRERKGPSGYGREEDEEQVRDQKERQREHRVDREDRSDKAHGQ